MGAILGCMVGDRIKAVPMKGNRTMVIPRAFLTNCGLLGFIRSIVAKSALLPLQFIVLGWGFGSQGDRNWSSAVLCDKEEKNQNQRDYEYLFYCLDYGFLLRSSSLSHHTCALLLMIFGPFLPPSSHRYVRWIFSESWDGTISIASQLVW